MRGLCELCIVLVATGFVWLGGGAGRNYTGAPAHAAVAATLHPAPPHAQANAAAMAIDLCAPCVDGVQCSSGLCLIDNATNSGICTQSCATSGSASCPPGFNCNTSSGSATSQCNPNDDTVCPAIYQGALLNDTCNYPASASGSSNTAFSRPCLQNLVCMIYPTSGFGSCLNECSSIDPNYSCQPGQNCCFGIDPNGQCLASSSAANLGGCIQIQQVGDSCVEADQSVCAPGAVCFNTGTAAASKCYTTCPSGTCGSAAQCVTINGVAVCCDASQFNINDNTTCLPLPGACKLEVGVACTLNADCKQLYCLKNGKQSACSVPCTSDAGCPSATQDVNGDGVADGGGSCLSLGVGNYCWPKTSPAAQPNCFVTAAAEAAAQGDAGGGCTCQGGAHAPLWALGLWGLALARRRVCRSGAP